MTFRMNLAGGRSRHARGITVLPALLVAAISAYSAGCLILTAAAL